MDPSERSVRHYYPEVGTHTVFFLIRCRYRQKGPSRLVLCTEEGWKQKPRQTVVGAVWGKLAAHGDCVADKLIKAGRASNIVTCVLIKTAVFLPVCTRSGGSDIHSEGSWFESSRKS